MGAASGRHDTPTLMGPSEMATKSAPGLDAPQRLLVSVSSQSSLND